MAKSKPLVSFATAKLDFDKSLKAYVDAGNQLLANCDGLISNDLIDKRFAADFAKRVEKFRSAWLGAQGGGE